MIELSNDALVFSFPEVHADARLTIGFQRTFRIPDDGRDYPLPPGFGRFPLRHVDDFARAVPPRWVEHGGVMLPMYQSEALWLNFHCEYPFAVKVAAGKINAVTGDEWSDPLQRRPQDYLVAPSQPWLDGYCVEKGFIRQFVAMPLGAGYSAEEQLTGEAEHGGIQVIAYPMKAEAYKRYCATRRRMFAAEDMLCSCVGAAAPDMGLAPGGRMRQEIFDDPHDFGDWEQGHASRCFVHIANSLVWRQIAGENPPTTPPTAQEYNDAGLPWFDYYDDGLQAVQGSGKLKDLDSVATKGQKEGQVPLPENESVTPKTVIDLRKGLKRGQVREW